MEGEVVDQLRTAAEEGVSKVCLYLRDVVVVNLRVVGEKLAGVDDETRKSSGETLSKYSVFKCQTVAIIISTGKIIRNVAVNSTGQKLADIIVVPELRRVVLERREEIHLLSELGYFVRHN